MLPSSPNLQFLIQNNMGKIKFMRKLSGYLRTMREPTNLKSYRYLVETKWVFMKLTKITQNLTKHLMKKP